MKNNVEAIYTPPGAEEYRQYMVPNHEIPPLRVEQLDTSILVGGARIGLKAPVTGDFSLVLTHKQKLAAVSSFQEDEDDLKVLQLQGARPAGLRVSACMNWSHLFAHEVVGIAQHPATTYTRLVISRVHDIEGLGNMTQEAMDRYNGFIAVALLRYSQIERAYIRDFSSKSREM